MKPFDLEKAKSGAKVCTRDGREVRIICYDVQDNRYTILVLVKYPSGREEPESYTKEGNYWYDKTISCNDLMIVGEKKEGWMNIYEFEDNIRAGSRIFQSKEEALEKRTDKDGYSYRDTVKVEWEE